MPGVDVVVASVVDVTVVVLVVVATWVVGAAWSPPLQAATASAHVAVMAIHRVRV